MKFTIYIFFNPTTLHSKQHVFIQILYVFFKFIKIINITSDDLQVSIIIYLQFLKAIVLKKVLNHLTSDLHVISVIFLMILWWSSCEKN